MRSRPPANTPAPGGSNASAVPTSPAPPATPGGGVAVSPDSGAPTPAPAAPSGTPSWQQAFWLEALLLTDANAAALGEELAWLALGPALPSGESTLALDLPLAGLASATTA
jgi:hypothetical protein